MQQLKHKSEDVANALSGSLRLCSAILLLRCLFGRYIYHVFEFKLGESQLAADPVALAKIVIKKALK